MNSTGARRRGGDGLDEVCQVEGPLGGGKRKLLFLSGELLVG